jgi:uncharacterized protein YndB with AHSA1/START domain
MPVNNDPSGRRWVQVEAEVPGTPEQVWQAIATGPGVSSWFVPTDIEEREGGRVISHFGPGNSMDSVATVTEWEPPRRFLAESHDLGPEAPPVATEWIVEAQAGGTCVVRVVHSWFASTDDWDGQYEQAEHGWPVFFQILRLYLTHFPGQPCTAFQLMGAASEPATAAWASLTGALGLSGVGVGQRVCSADGAPTLAGLVDQVGPDQYPGLLLVLNAPAPGIAHLFALPMGGQTFLPIRLFLYGDQASAVAASAEPAWQTWLAGRFPPAPQEAAANS